MVPTGQAAGIAEDTDEDEDEGASEDPNLPVLDLDHIPPESVVSQEEFSAHQKIILKLLREKKGTVIIAGYSGASDKKQILGVAISPSLFGRFPDMPIKGTVRQGSDFDLQGRGLVLTLNSAVNDVTTVFLDDKRRATAAILGRARVPPFLKSYPLISINDELPQVRNTLTPEAKPFVPQPAFPLTPRPAAPLKVTPSASLVSKSVETFGLNLTAFREDSIEANWGRILDEVRGSTGAAALFKDDKITGYFVTISAKSKLDLSDKDLSLEDFKNEGTGVAVPKIGTVWNKKTQ